MSEKRTHSDRAEAGYDQMERHLAAFLDVEAGLRDILLGAGYAQLSDDLNEVLDVEAGLAEVLGAFSEPSADLDLCSPGAPDSLAAPVSELHAGGSDERGWLDEIVGSIEQVVGWVYGIHQNAMNILVAGGWAEDELDKIYFAVRVVRLRANQLQRVADAFINRSTSAEEANRSILESANKLRDLLLAWNRVVRRDRRLAVPLSEIEEMLGMLGVLPRMIDRLFDGSDDLVSLLLN
ncbi:hypothetical protein [Micromonospora okii]|uniref:hypothetical protein n=1 Tax=Micromonospora okii TaxID=1182970 RepID=UPI001E49B140|nr:hypothetical protein [Micromonospora okii]